MRLLHTRVHPDDEGASSALSPPDNRRDSPLPVRQSLPLRFLSGYRRSGQDGCRGRRKHRSRLKSEHAASTRRDWATGRPSPKRHDAPRPSFALESLLIAPDEVAQALEERGFESVWFRGTRQCDVRLWIDGARLGYACTCPVAAAHSVDRHRVLISLIVPSVDDQS